MFKIKDGHKLELQTPKTMKLFGSANKLTDKTKNGENVPSLRVVKVNLVNFNFIDNQYQRKSEVLYTFTPNKSYAYLLNVEPSNAKINEVVITFTDQNGRLLDIKDKVNLILLINKEK